MSEALSPTPEGAQENVDGAQPVLMFFFSQTSGASRRVDGYLAQVLQRRGNHSTFRLLRVDADQRPDLVEQFRVSEVPTLVVALRGRVRGRLSRPSGCTEISSLLSPWLR